MLLLREKKMCQCFLNTWYELTADLASLFKEGLMRKAYKSQLRHALTNSVEDVSIENNKTDCFVLDGGTLIHKVRWVKDDTYQQIALCYVEYIKERFGTCCVVFDVYGKASTKDEEHQRRRTRKTSPKVTVNEGNVIYSNQDAFLANESNKAQLISLLEKYLISAHNTVEVCPEEADTQIVKRALEFSRQGKSVTVVADDTDVFVLLAYHFEPKNSDIFFLSDKAKKMWSIAKIASTIDPIIKNNILFYMRGQSVTRPLLFMVMEKHHL